MTSARKRRDGTGPGVGLVVHLLVFLLVFVAGLYLSQPGAAARLQSAIRPAPLVDAHFPNCAAARAAGREDIPAWDPSYRERMDRDGDGLACEPYRY